jgi:hypothetical protein
MITKDIENIDASDLDSLISTNVAESRTLEYKRDLPGFADGDKKEFLADVSSFANATGGDLLFGIEESEGAAVAISGVGDVNLDSELRRLDSVILAGIDPRIHYRIRAITASNGATVVLIRVSQSWLAPHRVVFKQSGHFYSRTSAGKYSLDTGELRQAFLRSAGLTESISRFRTQRLAEISSDRTPITLSYRGRLVVHLVPLEAFASAKRLQLSESHYYLGKLPLLGDHGANSRFTLNGVLTYATLERGAIGYTELYRTGIIEAVDAYILNIDRGDGRTIPSLEFEHYVLEGVRKYVQLFRELEIQPPIYLGVSLLGVRGVRMAVHPALAFLRNPASLNDDLVMIPESSLASYDTPVEVPVREQLDMVWNAFGFKESPNFNSDGLWKPGAR